MEKVLFWWERGVYGALCLSILLLGFGRLELGFSGQSMSAWSVSRTTLGFWVILRVLRWRHAGRPQFDRAAALQLAPLGAFFAVVTLSLLPDFRSAGDYRYLVLACAHAVMVIDVCADASRQRWLLRIMAVAPLVFVVRGLVDAPEVFQFALSYRFDHPLDHANTAGYLLAMSIPLCLYVVHVERGWRRWLAGLSCLGQILALLLTYSRGAWLGWIAAMFFFGIVHRHWRYLMVTLLVAAACVAALPPLRQRVVSVVRPGSDVAIGERLHVLKGAIRLGLDHPVLGVGYGRGRLKQELRRSYQDEFSSDIPIWHAHNVYAELFAGTGLLGLGAFVWLIGGTLRRLLRRARAHATAERLLGLTLATSWSAAAVAGIGDIPFYHHEPRIFFFSLFALAYLYCQDTDSTSHAGGIVLNDSRTQRS